MKETQVLLQVTSTKNTDQLEVETLAYVYSDDLVSVF